MRDRLPIVKFGAVIDSIAGGATPLRANEDQYADSGIRFLRIQNVTLTGFSFRDVKFITEEIHNNLLLRSQLAENDLLMTITGRIGTCAVVTRECLPANINQHIVRVRLKPGVDPRFAAAYFNSSIGLMLSNRGVTGTTRTALDYESIRNIPFPLVGSTEQTRFIEEAESAQQSYMNRLKTAEKLLNSFESEVTELLGFSQNTQIRMCYAIKLGDVDGVIDAKRYARAKKDGEHTIEDICKILDEKVNVSSLGDETIDWIRIDDLSNHPLEIKRVRTLPAYEMEGSFFRVKEGDILVARLGPTILNQKIVLVRKTERETLASAEFLVLRCKKGYDAESIMAVLKTAYYRDLMYAQSRGSTPSRYRLNREDMGKLPFPDLRNVQHILSRQARELREQVKLMRLQAEQEWREAREQFERELLGR